MRVVLLGVLLIITVKASVESFKVVFAMLYLLFKVDSHLLALLHSITIFSNPNGNSWNTNEHPKILIVLPVSI